MVLNWLRQEINPNATEVDHHLQFGALGIDSVAAMSLTASLEKALGRRLPDEIFFEYQTIAELVGYLNELPARRSASTAEPRPLDKLDYLRSLERGVRRIRQLDAAGHNYFATEIQQQQGSYVVVDGRRMLMMASYNDLGLSNRSEVNRATEEAVRSYGTGQFGSRLLARTFDAHRRLERKIAQFFQTEDAIVYSSGFVTNIASIAALVTEGDVVIGDELNHASIVDGCRFSEAEFLTFRHSNMHELEALLKQHAGRRILVVIDGVFSMDGDILPLPAIVELCQRYGALLMVDEAHSLGVVGKTGRGVQEHFGLANDAIDLKMGTLSKSIASCGGFIAARREIVEFLRYNARGYVFSAALPAPQVAAALQSFEILQNEPHHADHLRQLRGRFVVGLRELGFEIPPTESAIIPIIFSSEQETLEAVGFCRHRGLFVVPVFYPAVPMDKPRIRATLMATFTDAEIDMALKVFGDLAKLRSTQHRIGNSGPGAPAITV